jgi:hypothetical protein
VEHSKKEEERKKESKKGQRPHEEAQRCLAVSTSKRHTIRGRLLVPELGTEREVLAAAYFVEEQKKKNQKIQIQERTQRGMNEGPTGEN